MKNKLFNYKYIIAHRLSSYPSLYSRISRFLSGDQFYTDKHTDIVIDGFPRCANTYATYAFDLIQPAKLNIAHHVHKISQFLVAEKYDIPCILLIRNPIDCITSLLIGWPRFNPETLFKAYYILYNGLKDSNSFVLADFENVLNDYGKVIEQVNSKFGTRFKLYCKNDENEAKVKDIIHKQEKLVGAKDFKERVSYPTNVRQKSINETKNLLLDKRYEYLNQKCTEVYQYLLQRNKM